GTNDPQLLQIKLVDVDLDPAAPVSTHRHQAPRLRQAVEGPRPDRAVGNVLGYHVGAMAVGDARDLGGEIVSAIVHRIVGAVGKAARDSLVRARAGDDAGAQ